MPHLQAEYSATEQKARAGARLVLRGIGLNIVLAAAKFAGGIFGHTYVLIADGTESLVDVFSSLIVWMGLRVAAEPPDDEHPYGHGKAESLAGLCVAFFVFGAAGWIGYHAIHEIITPHQGPHWLTLPLLVAVVAAKLWFSQRMRVTGAEVGSTGLTAEAWHHYADAITSAAAFIGIAIAVWGGAGYETADDWAALFACVIVAISGVGIFRRALGDAMDSAVPEEFANEVRGIAQRVPGVLALDKCRVRKSGLTYLVDIQVRVDGDLTVRAGHDIAHAVKDALIGARKLAISDVIVHVEPMK